MASILAGDIRKGSTFEYNGKGVYTVTEFQHVKPGKGAAFVRATLKNVVTGQVLSDITFNPTAKLETAQVETKKMTYSYTDGEFYYFMDPDSFDMITLNFDQVEDALKYIKESFIFGYGFENSAIRVIKFNYLQAVTCHNQLLDLLYQGGIVGVTLLSGALIELNKNIKNIKNNRIKVLSLVALSTYFIMMLSEYYSFNNYIFIFAIILNLSSIIEERSGNNGTSESINNNTSI